jgi:hypothetical protein
MVLFPFHSSHWILSFFMNKKEAGGDTCHPGILTHAINSRRVAGKIPGSQFLRYI